MQELFLTTVVIIIIGIAAYFLYNWLYESKDLKSTTDRNRDVELEERFVNLGPYQPKRVQFNDDVDCRYFRSDRVQPPSQTTVEFPKQDTVSLADRIRSKLKRSGIQVAEPEIKPDFTRADIEARIPIGIEAAPKHLIEPSATDTWDSSFGIPLMDPEEKRMFAQRMQANMNKYTHAVDKFAEFRDNRDNVEKAQTTLDPFVTDHRSSSLIGKTIKEIYDEQTAGPRPKPKEVLDRTRTNTYYKDENSMNGAYLEGTRLTGFDGLGDMWQTSQFSNGF